jgi:hypothetical protein
MKSTILTQYILEVLSGAMRGSARFSAPNLLRYGSATTGHYGGNVLLDAEEEEEELNEAAISTDEASANGLALCVTQISGGQRYILYSTELAKSLIEDYSTITDAIFGYIVVSTDDSDGLWQVTTSVARKGYGPLMYDLVLSDAPVGVMPDRGGVSKSAEKIWQFYSTRSDVISKPLPEGAEHHGDPILDRYYKLKSPINASALAASHQKFVKELTPIVLHESFLDKSTKQRVLKY